LVSFYTDEEAVVADLLFGGPGKGLKMRMEKHDVPNRKGDLMEFNMIYIDLP